MTTTVTYQVPITLKALRSKEQNDVWASAKAVRCSVGAEAESLYLAYFWKLISFGMERGRITSTAVTTMVNLRSVYQWLLTVLSVSWVRAAITATEGKNRREESVNDSWAWAERWANSCAPVGLSSKVEENHVTSAPLFCTVSITEHRWAQLDHMKGTFTHWKSWVGSHVVPFAFIGDGFALFKRLSALKHN